MGNKLRTTVSASAIALGIALSSQAARAADPVEQVVAPDWYVSVFGGGSFGFAHSNVDNDIQQIVLDDGYIIGGTIGTHFAPNWRIEGELSYVRNSNNETRESVADPFDPMSGNTEALFFMTNIWRDFDLGVVRPYVGAGLGTGLLRVRGENNDTGDSVSWDDTNVTIAGQIGAGIRFPITDRLSADLGYRFKSAVEAGFLGTDFNGIGEDENSSYTFYTHVAQLGLTYEMGDTTGTSSPISEDSDWYVSVFGGLALPERTVDNYGSIYAINNKDGFSLGVAAGTRITPRLRGELELSYINKSLDDVSASATAVPDPATGSQDQFYILTNLWHDIPMGMVSPYFGGGIGVGFVDFGNATLDGNLFTDQTGVGFAAQFGAGVRANVSDNIAIDAGYRFKTILNAFVGGDAADNDGNSAASTYDHVLQAAVTYGFGGAPVVEDDGSLGNWYVSVFGGGVFPADNHISADYSSNYFVKYKDGFTVGAAIGREVADNLRAEFELSYVNYDPKTSNEQGSTNPAPGEMQFVYAMGNLWHDFDLGVVKPYAGIGLGLAFSDIRIDLAGPGSVQLDDSSISLAAQAGSGVRVGVTDNMALDLGYRFKAATGVLTGDIDGSGWGYGFHYQHVVQAGLTWGF